MGRPSISSTNLGPLLSIMNWILLAWSSLTVIARLTVRLYMIRKLSIDDVWVVISLGFSVAQSCVFGVQVKNGLGRTTSELQLDSLNDQHKAEYSARLLYVCCLFFAKLAALSMLYALSRDQFYRRSAAGLGVAFSVWAVVSIFVFAFACPLPSPWSYGSQKCYNLVSADDYFAATNLITELLLLIFPCVIISRLNLRMKDKTVVISTFMFRITVVAAIICEVYFQHKVQHQGDRSLTLWRAALCRQIVQALSIIASCVIYLRPFLESLESGFIRVNDLKRRGQDYGSGSSSGKTSAPTSDRRPSHVRTWSTAPIRLEPYISSDSALISSTIVGGHTTSPPSAGEVAPVAPPAGGIMTTQSVKMEDHYIAVPKHTTTRNERILEEEERELGESKM